MGDLGTGGLGDWGTWRRGDGETERLGARLVLKVLDRIATANAAITLQRLKSPLVMQSPLRGPIKLMSTKI